MKPLYATSVFASTLHSMVIVAWIPLTNGRDEKEKTCSQEGESRTQAEQEGQLR